MPPSDVSADPGQEKPAPLVLVADDDENTLLLHATFLRRAGYRVETAGDGAEALEKVRGLQPDLVLLDIDMPRMTGYDVCRSMKPDPDLGSIPIILVTGGGDSEDRTRAFEIGADDLFAKPMKRGEFLARVELELRRKELGEARHQLEIERIRGEEEVLRRAFLKEVIYSVTNGRLKLAERDEMDAVVEAFQPSATVDLVGPECVRAARHAAEEVATEAGLPEEALHDLVLCVSEAATNTLKHATGGRMQVGLDAGRVLVLLSDEGPGIDASALPRATLMKGYSTKVSLGMGFSLMLELLDRVTLDTSRSGTRLLLEKGPPAPPLDLDEFMKNF